MRPPFAPRQVGSWPAATAVRYLLVIGVLVGAAGVGGRLLSWPLLTASLGPTAYVFAAHPGTEIARLRNALIGHTVAVGAGLAALAVFGLVHHPSVSATGAPSIAQVAASAVASGVTVLLLELVGLHYAPAAATALLVATGLAQPGSPLTGLVLGLAIVIALGSLLSLLLPVRAEAVDGQVPTSAKGTNS